MYAGYYMLHRSLMVAGLWTPEVRLLQYQNNAGNVGYTDSCQHNNTISLSSLNFKLKYMLKFQANLITIYCICLRYPNSDNIRKLKFDTKIFSGQRGKGGLSHGL